MPLCGFNRRMIEGIVIFSEGLYEATIQRGQQNGASDITAITTEVEEIRMFIDALQGQYGITVDTPKRMAEMIHGIAIFSGALFKSTLERNTGKADLKPAFDQQVEKISTFLEHLENKHQELKKAHPPMETMVKAVEWIDDNDLPGRTHFGAQTS